MLQQKLLINRSSKALVEALGRFQSKAVRDQVIKTMIAQPKLSTRQKLDFIDVARDTWGTPQERDIYVR